MVFNIVCVWVGGKLGSFLQLMAEQNAEFQGKVLSLS